MFNVNIFICLFTIIYDYVNLFIYLFYFYLKRIFKEKYKIKNIN